MAEVMGAPLRVIDMFAGIGGFSLGLHRAGGFETVAVAETDPYASKVLAKRFGVPNVGDVTTAEYPNADIICAGFPCQDISFAGAGAGLAGSRSGLWREVVRAIRVVRPRFAILENVAALLNRGMGTVLGDLAEVGHDAEWHCIPASAVGAPHRRDRIWIFTGADSPPLLGASILRGEPDEDHERAGEVADTKGIGRRPGRSRRAAAQGQERKAARQDVGNACRAAGERNTRSVHEAESGKHSPRQQHGAEPHGFEHASSGGGAGWWHSEPDVGRVAHGIPKRVDRLRCLGNAVVPQIPEIIGRALLAAIGDRSRQAETENTGSVHEGAGPQGIAQ